MNVAVVWLLGTLAAYRLWRLVALDTITAGIRDRLPSRVVDPLTCPWCAGAWTSAALFVAIQAVEPFTSWPMLAVCAAAASTVVGLIGANLDG